MKIKSLALASFTSACFLLTNSFALNVLAHPGGSHIKVRPSPRATSPRATTTKNVYFTGTCVDVSLNITDSGAVYGSSNQCGAPYSGSSYPSYSAVAGHISTINGIPNTIVISGNFGNLYGKDTFARFRPIMVAIFPDNTFKAYSGSYLGVTQDLELIATGNWSSTRSRLQKSLLPFGANQRVGSKIVRQTTPRTTILRTLVMNGYCKAEARITDGIVHAFISSAYRNDFCYTYSVSAVSGNVGGVVVSGVPGVQDGTIVLNHVFPPGHTVSGGFNHFHYLFGGGNSWWTYHVSKSSLILSGQSTYFESAPPRP